ncbi:MAG: rod shape determining protein RodA [Planctomycetota bacterium]|jgi:rod shape determining protein RodA
MRRLTTSLNPRELFGLRHLQGGEFAWHVLLIALSLLAFGLIFVNAIAMAPASRSTSPVDFDSHSQKVVLTFPLLLFGVAMRPKWLRRNAHWIYFGTVVLLALVPFIGDERNNAKRWIQLPGFDLQPSELAKLGIILVLAQVLQENRLRKIEDWVRPTACVVLPICLVVLQPDLGTALTLVPVTLGMFYLAGARASAIIGLCLTGLLIATVAVKSELVRGYQLKRIDTWMSAYTPEGVIGEKNRAGFHVHLARTSIGNGGMHGRGLGRGVANDTGYLPERESDSIFAVIAEETGFVACSALLLMYVLLVILLMRTASALRDRFARLTVGGIALYFAAHLFVNTSVNLGLLPMTGLPLPLFSTGGSSMLVTFAAIGIALGLSARQETSFAGDE